MRAERFRWHPGVAEELRALVRPGDLVLIHDAQPVGLAAELRRAGARVVWRSHIGRDELPFPETEARRLTMHEFGHALGMLHEHQSPTGGCGPEYDEEALMAYGALLGWSREKATSMRERAPLARCSCHSSW